MCLNSFKAQKFDRLIDWIWIGNDPEVATKTPRRLPPETQHVVAGLEDGVPIHKGHLLCFSTLDFPPCKSVCLNMSWSILCLWLALEDLIPYGFECPSLGPRKQEKPTCGSTAAGSSFHWTPWLTTLPICSCTLDWWNSMDAMPHHVSGHGWLQHPKKKRAKVILSYYMAGKINFKWWILQQTMPDFQSVWFSTWGKGNICDEHFPALMFTRTMFGPKATCSGTLENVLSHWPVVKWQGHLHAYCNLSIRSD